MKVIVVSDVIGIRAGAYFATLQLCGQLSRMGHEVTCYAATVEGCREVEDGGFELVEPLLRKGWRYDMPFRSLAWQASRAIAGNRAGLVIAVGLTRLTRYLLKRSAAGQVLVWELTNATTGNKFVDQRAISLLPGARGVLSPSAAIDEAIRLNYGYQGRIQRLPFWIEEQALQSNAGEGADFIFLGRRDVDKGLNELIRATASLLPDFPATKVLVAGHGDHAPFAQLADSLRVGTAVDFRTFPERDEAMRALSSAKCLVLPSYHEGYPLVLLEAGRAGIPIIATNVGSIPSMFAGCGGCTIIPPRDSESLSRAMRELLIEPAESRLSRGACLREHFECHLSREVAVARLIEFVDGTADRAGELRTH